MNSNLKLFLFGVLALALVVSVWAAIHFYNKSQAPVQAAAALKILKDPSVKADTNIDNLGYVHSQIPANTNVIQQAALKDPAVKRDSSLQKIDQALNLVDASHLLEVTTENMQLRAAVLRLKRDSANLALLAYSDHSISFQYDPRDSTLRNLAINLHLNQVKYSKRKLFSDYPVYDFWADDPRVTFSGFTHFSVAIPPPLIGLTEATRLTYDFKSGHVYPAQELDLRVKNWHFTGREYWSIRNQHFQPQLALSYQKTIF